MILHSEKPQKRKFNGNLTVGAGAGINLSNALNFKF